jgi:competence protein ComGF
MNELLSFVCCLCTGGFLALIAIRVVRDGVQPKRFTLREMMVAVACIATMLWIFSIVGRLYR